MEYAFYTMIGIVGCCCFLPCLAVCVMHRRQERSVTVQPELTFVVPTELISQKLEDPC